MRPNSVVWILGAGFSKPLGAPLLTQLMTPRSALRVAAAYDKVKSLENVEETAALYASGYDAKRESGRDDGEWAHAEEFLERLDLAVVNPTMAKVLVGYCRSLGIVQTLGGTNFSFARADESEVRGMRVGGLRLLAAECCLFLKDMDADMERFAPYRAWAKSLEPTDTVITFNYDRVIENVADARPDGIAFPIPSEIDQDHDKQACVIKMHGSVDWLQTGIGIERATTSMSAEQAKEAALHCKDEEIALATPGPTKQDMITDQMLLAPLWQHAAQRLESAGAIVFVGYRMPPTDAYTKQWLIDALTLRLGPRMHAMTSGAGVPVHTVLGPDVNHEHSVRLAGLLAEIGTGIQLKQWKLGSEDFLGLISRDRLLKLLP